MSHYFCSYLFDLFDLLPVENRHKSPLTKKSTQTTQPTFPSKGKNQREEEYNPKAWEKKTSSGASYEKKKEKKKIMKRQKYSTNERARNSQDQINKEETSNLPETEFRIMIVKML